MAGYSPKPLLQKLGYTPGDTVFCADAPAWFLDKLRLAGVTPSDGLPATWLHGFFTDLPELIEFLNQVDLDGVNKGFWMSWPKKASGAMADITEQTFRDLILPMGWVDTKVCAVDDTWSGLKFLRRKGQKPISE